MSKKFKFILLTIGFFVLFIQIQPVSALPIDVNDSFDGPALRSDLWKERFVSHTPLFGPSSGQFVSNDHMEVLTNTSGAYILESNFYYTGDFDTTVDLYFSSGVGALRFYKYDEDHKAVPYGPGNGTIGDTWGFAGHPYSGFLEGQTLAWSYTPSGYNSFFVANQWYQLRVKRTGSQITTYHRLGKDSSDPWVEDNTFFNFSGSIYIDLASSQGSSAQIVDAMWDNFTSDILASTDPSGFNAVPEPATMALFGFGLLGLAGIGRRKTRNA